MASNIRGITVEIGGNTVKLDKALERVNTRSKNLQSDLTKVNKLLKFDPSNTTLLSQKQDILRTSINNTKIKLSELQDVQEQISQQYARGEIDKGSYQAFQRELESTKQKLKHLQDESKKFGSVFAQQVKVAGTHIQDLGCKIEATGKSFSMISTVASGGLVLASKSAIDFESAWAGVTKTVEGTDEQMANIQQGILDLSKSTASSAEDIAQVAENAGQLGVKTENILAFTETMVRLGDSTNISADEASSAIAKLYNIMGGDINTVDQFGASIVALGNNMATTEADIMNMATRVAGSGKQIGLTEQEILALSASLSSVGLEAEAGGSAISAIMTQIDKDVALNNDTLATWADVAGMSTKKFKTLWETDAMSAIQSIVKGMGDASAGGENLNVILEDLGVESLRQTDTMKRLSGASEMLGDSVKISNEAWSENTALTAESDKRYETTASKIQQLKNTFTELGVKLGEILLPIIQKIVEKVSSLVEWFTNLNPTAQKIILVITGIVASLAPALIIIGKVISAVGTIMTYAPQIMNVITKIKGLITGLFSVISAHPIIAIITAIIAIVILLYNKCEWFRNGVNNILKAVVNFFKSAWEGIKSAWSTATEWFSNIVNGIYNYFSSIPERLRSFFSNAWAGIKSAWASVKSWFSGIVQAIFSYFQSIPSRLTNFFSNAWNNIKSVWSNVKSFFSNVISTVTDTFKSLPSKMLQIGKDVVDGLVNGIRNKIEAVKSAITDVTSSITQKCKSILGIASPSRVMKALGEFTSEGLAIGIKEKGKKASDAMSNVTKSVINSADTKALMNLGVKDSVRTSGNNTVNNNQAKGGTVINFNGNYHFKDKNDIDYFMNQAGLKLVGVR